MAFFTAWEPYIAVPQSLNSATRRKLWATGGCGWGKSGLFPSVWPLIQVIPQAMAETKSSVANLTFVEALATVALAAFLAAPAFLPASFGLGASVATFSVLITPCRAAASRAAWTSEPFASRGESSTSGPRSRVSFSTLASPFRKRSISASEGAWGAADFLAAVVAFPFPFGAGAAASDGSAAMAFFIWVFAPGFLTADRAFARSSFVTVTITGLLACTASFFVVFTAFFTGPPFRGAWCAASS